MTAENSSPIHPRSAPAARFNEAAADDRGKLGDPMLDVLGRTPASMRPRPMTAENAVADLPRLVALLLQ